MVSRWFLELQQISSLMNDVCDVTLRWMDVDGTREKNRPVKNRLDSRPVQFNGLVHPEGRSDSSNRVCRIDLMTAPCSRWLFSKLAACLTSILFYHRANLLALIQSRGKSYKARSLLGASLHQKLFYVGIHTPLHERGERGERENNILPFSQMNL